MSSEGSRLDRVPNIHKYPRSSSTVLLGAGIIQSLTQLKAAMFRLSEGSFLQILRLATIISRTVSMRYFGIAESPIFREA